MKACNHKAPYTLLGFHTGLRFTILATALLGSGCMLSYPDSCEQSRCSLKPDASEPKQPSTSLALGDTRLVAICACRPLNSSGIQVEIGQQYIFHIAEISEPWIDGSVCATPGRGWEGTIMNFLGNIGSTFKRSDKGNWYALMGVVGQVDPPPDDKESFTLFNEVSNDSAPIPITRAGQLFFYANDKNGRYFNNRGALQLEIIRIK